MVSPALLLVFIDPGSEVSEEELHEWYGEEHIPIRVEKLSAFRSAARYKAIDGTKPKFAAMYTISDSAVFTDPEYTVLREQRSPREADLIKRLATLDRRIYDLISDTTPLPYAIRPSSIAASIVVANSFTPAPSDEEAFHNWYENEYVPALKDVPGWNRTRRFKLADVVVSGLDHANGPPKEPPTYLEISEFDALSSLHSPKFPSETAGSQVITAATQSERRVLKLIKTYQPTAALRSIKTPGTPAV